MTKKKKQPLKERLQEHIAEYGGIALTIFFLIFVLTYLGFYIAITTGADVGDTAAGSTGTFIAAWLATKLTLPLRIAGTLVLTPIASALLHRLRPQRSGNKSPPAESESKDS